MADRLTHATIRFVRLPTRAALNAAHDTDPDHHRDLVYVGVHPNGEQGGSVAGWGECSALNRATYTPESARGAYESLVSGNPVDPTTQPMAAAGVEMAKLDYELRQDNIALAERLGTSGAWSPAGAVVGIAPIAMVVGQVEELAAQGYDRVKIKVTPAHLIEAVRAVVTGFEELEIQVDANGSLTESDLPALHELESMGVRVVEQPFAVGHDGVAARLVAESGLEIMADESATSVEAITALAKHKAATALAIKPPRCGGVQAALEMIRVATECGLKCSIGGMLESGLGRSVLAALAPLDPFSITGDLSPARRWLSQDPFDDIEIRGGAVAAPDRIGIAGDPDIELLEHFTIERATVELPPITRGPQPVVD